MTLNLQQQIDNLNKTEMAMLNILEDAREMEKIIKKERDQSRAIISSMGEGLFVIDNFYKIILLNKAAEKIIGLSANEIIGQNAKKIIEVFKGNKKLSDEERPAEKMFKNGETVVIEIEDDFYYQIIPSGKKFPVRFITAPLMGNGIIGAVVIFRDITQEKMLDEMKLNFISIASHQLRTPLTTIRWYVEMLNTSDVGSLNENQKNFLSQIYSGVLKLGDTLNMLLFLTRIEGKQIKIIPSKLNLLRFTESIIKEFKPLIDQKKLNLTVDVNVKKPELLEIYFDQSILNQVIVNLLSNAIRYTNEKGNINIKMDYQEKEFVYSIKDNGIGIPENQKTRIFEKFFRAKNAEIKTPEGNGLGLTLVKNLVEFWKGKIWFESEEGKGTIFYFTIPFL